MDNAKSQGIIYEVQEEIHHGNNVIVRKGKLFRYVAGGFEKPIGTADGDFKPGDRAVIRDSIIKKLEDTIKEKTTLQEEATPEEEEKTPEEEVKDIVKEFEEEIQGIANDDNKEKEPEPESPEMTQEDIDKEFSSLQELKEEELKEATTEQSEENADNLVVHDTKYAKEEEYNTVESKEQQKDITLPEPKEEEVTNISQAISKAMNQKETKEDQVFKSPQSVLQGINKILKKPDEDFSGVGSLKNFNELENVLNNIKEKNSKHPQIKKIVEIIDTFIKENKPKEDLPLNTLDEVTGEEPTEEPIEILPVEILERRLTNKQRIFCNEYILDFNGKRAALSVGYSSNCAKEIAHENLTKPHLQQYIDYLLKERKDRAIVTEEQVLADLRLIKQRCLQEVPVYDKEGNHTGEYKFESNSALKATELEGKYLGIFKDKVEAKVENTNIELSPEERKKKIEEYEARRKERLQREGNA